MRKLSEHCNFAEKLKENLRDKFVCCLNDERMQQKLLAIRDLTLETAIDTAVAMEAAVRSAKEIVGRNTLGNNNNNAGEIHRLGEGKGNYNNFQGGSKRECSIGVVVVDILKIYVHLSL